MFHFCTAALITINLDKHQENIVHEMQLATKLTGSILFYKGCERVKITFDVRNAVIINEVL